VSFQAEFDNPLADWMNRIEEPAVVTWREKRGRENSRQRFLSNASLLWEAGGAGVSTSTLGAISSALSAKVLRALRSKAFNRKERKEQPQRPGRKPLTAAAARVCPKAGAVGNSTQL